MLSKPFEFQVAKRLQGKGLIMLTPKKTFPMVLAQVNSGNTSEKLLTQIKKIIESHLVLE